MSNKVFNIKQNIKKSIIIILQAFQNVERKKGKSYYGRTSFFNPMKKTSKGFFKNCPIGRNEISKWTRQNL
jgi:hypothetical protein